MLIPQCVYDKYDSITTQMINELGILCTVMYPAINTVITQSVPLFKTKNTLLPTSDVNAFHLGSGSYKAVESSGTIQLLLYWSQRDWKKIANVNIPDGGLMAIGFKADLPKIKHADHILVYTNGYNAGFSLLSEPVPYGLTNNYINTFWKRNA